MTESWSEEEYYEEPYYDDYLEDIPGRTWSTLALVVSGCIGLVLGFICAACLSLVLGGFFLTAPASSTAPPAAQAPDTAQDWVRVLRQSGLEVENPQDLVSLGENLPPGATSGIQFEIPSYCGGCGGKLIVFESAEQAAPMAEWLQSMGQYAYSRERVLIQIDGQVPREVALQYRTVLMEY